MAAVPERISPDELFALWVKALPPGQTLQAVIQLLAEMRRYQQAGNHIDSSNAEKLSKVLVYLRSRGYVRQ